MARISGINIPLNKRVEIGLTYIYGIGQSTSNVLLKDTGISPDTYVRDLTEDEVGKLRDAIDRTLTVEGDLRRERSQDIKRLMEIGCYRGLRHRRGRPAPRALAGHQPPDGSRLPPRLAPPPRPAGARAEDEDQRAYAQGSEAHAGRR